MIPIDVAWSGWLGCQGAQSCTMLSGWPRVGRGPVAARGLTEVRAALP